MRVAEPEDASRREQTPAPVEPLEEIFTIAEWRMGGEGTMGQGTLAFKFEEASVQVFLLCFAAEPQQKKGLAVSVNSGTPSTLPVAGDDNREVRGGS